MSGFITIYNTDGKPVDKQLIHSLTETLKFRGPDQQKVWIDNTIGMGHALFKTTFEAEYENQPATIDNRVWITCSARIDDRENLVNKMGLKQSLELSKTPDSELILHAYRKWGEACLEHLLGDFAFVIWDKKKQKLFCARDRFGANQLYYAEKNNSIIICNTLNTIKQHPLISRQLNDKAIAGFLLFGDHTWIDKTLTVLSNVKTLPPAHSITLQNGKTSLKKYWDISPDLPILRYKKESDYIEHFNEIFKVSIADRIRTNALTIAMSGGMDSSSVAATVRQLEKENTIPPLTLNAVTAVYDRILPCQERHYAGIVAKHLNIPIHYLIGENYTFMRPLVLTTRPLEIYTFTLWKEIKKTIAAHSRVALTGASADNLLMYSPAITTMKEVNPIKVLMDLFQLKKRYQKRPAIGSGLLAMLKLKHKQKGNKNILVRPRLLSDWFNPEFEKAMELKKIWEETSEWNPNPLHTRHPNAHNTLTGIDWNTDDIIMESEFTLSEERDPFLDLRLVEFLFSIPSLPWFFEKHILRQSMAEMLPQEIIRRPKTPLGDLHGKFMLESSSSWINDWQVNNDLLPYVQPDKIPSAIQASSDYTMREQRLRILNLGDWIKAFKSND
ncbi:asparagine synthetase B family protein [Sulfurovum mangrovi]|uniref:asparagine synthetase B family protein n=1 Tax=Sulfurovum mangrovi TaxID=2893889 RepID=UPI001E3B28F4|nr:asparagine synthase-related protein [Sulfurovum mangrovi]UFH58937.1 hypothetical protein LN246_11385 [Sulfurovum mangrovi]